MKKVILEKKWIIQELNLIKINIMTVKELKSKLDGIDDNLLVLIPQSFEFDGAFYSPCSEDSGVSTMGTDPHATEEDIAEMKLLGKTVPEEDVFLLIPCGFGEEKEHIHKYN